MNQAPALAMELLEKVVQLRKDRPDLDRPMHFALMSPEQIEALRADSNWKPAG